MNLSVLFRRGVLVLAAATCGVSPFANALPAFARQTGQSCAACHVGALGPQLTALGQTFKLGGYTMGGKAGDTLPVSGMVVLTHEHTSKALPDDAGPHDGPNNNSNLQEASVFLAGKLSDHVGSFAQITYSDIDRKLALDNVDVRYADHATLWGKSVNWGVSVNNNPTLQDPWNSMPAWRFPYTSSELAPAPGAATLINGGLEHQVLGTTLYGMWDSHLYTEIGGYRSLSSTFLRKTNVDDEAGKISGTAPYARLAYTDTMGGQNFNVGVFGLRASLHPDRGTGATNVYTDFGADAGWQYALSKDDLFSVNASYVREHQQLDFSVAAGDAAKNSLHLHEFNASASYYFQNTYGLTFGYFNTTGNGDATLYAPGPLSGSKAGNPDSRGYVVQADWTPWGKANSWGSPWANVRLGVQYVDYTRFNGGSKNYDGFGRSASDNNTLFLFAWWAF